MYAAFAAIGAFWSVAGVLYGIGVVLLWMRVLPHESGPPRLEPMLLPAAAAGSFVALRLGGWRAFIGLVAFASVGFIRALTYPIGAAIDCSHGNTDACRGATDLDFVIPQAWVLPGLALGALGALRTRARVPLRIELEALSPIALAQVIYVFAPSLLGYPRPSTFDIVLTTVAVIVAAYVVARRSRSPTRSALIVAGALLLLDLPWITFEIWLNTDPESGPLDRWLYFVRPVVLVAAAYGLSKMKRGAQGRSATNRAAP